MKLYYLVVALSWVIILTEVLAFPYYALRIDNLYFFLFWNINVHNTIVFKNVEIMKSQTLMIQKTFNRPTLNKNLPNHPNKKSSKFLVFHPKPPNLICFLSTPGFIRSK